MKPGSPHWRTFPVSLLSISTGLLLIRQIEFLFNQGSAKLRVHLEMEFPSSQNDPFTRLLLESFRARIRLAQQSQTANKLRHVGFIERKLEQIRQGASDHLQSFGRYRKERQSYLALSALELLVR